MKRKFKNGFLLSTLLFSAISNAQDIDLITPASGISDQIKGIFPYVVGIIFLVVVIVNLGHFTKDGGDWKKGVFNILIYVIVVSAVAGLFTFVTSISL